MTRKYARADSETLSSPSDAITLVDTLTGESGKENNQNIAHLLPNGNTNIFHRFGVGSIDAGANYASRRSINGGADSTQTNGNAVLEGVGTATDDDKLDNGYFTKLSAQELLWISHHIDRNNAGAANVPLRSETVAKWVNLTGVVDTLSVNNGGAGSHDTNSNTAWFTGIDQAIARFASMREAFQALSNPFNQRFVEWFSGSQLSSIWDQNSLFGSPVFAMVDDINEGFGISHDTTNPSQGAIIAGNTERPFDFDACVMHTITRRVEANGNTQAGWANRSDGDFGNTPDDSVKYQQTSLQTFIRFVTIRNLSTTVVLTTVPSDQIFHHIRQELFGSSATIEIEGKLEATSVTDLPILKLYAGFKENNTGGGTIGEARIRYMEVFNTA